MRGQDAEKPGWAGLGAESVFVKRATQLPDGLPACIPFAGPEGSDSLGGWLLQQARAVEFQDGLRRSGWKWFYIGHVFTVNGYGRLNGETMERLLMKIATEVDRRGANCFTITAVEVKRMLGFSTAYLTAQPRHVQRGFPGDQVKGE